MRLRHSILLSLAAIAAISGCETPLRSRSMYYIGFDTNQYLRPSATFERINHDSSAPINVNYFRWLHGPDSYAPSPSDDAEAYRQTPNNRGRVPAVAPDSNRIQSQETPESSPNRKPAPAASEPDLPPVEIVVPPELSPPPERTPLPAPAEDDWQARQKQKTISPSQELRQARLPGARVFFSSYR